MDLRLESYKLTQSFQVWRFLTINLEVHSILWFFWMASARASPFFRQEAKQNIAVNINLAPEALPQFNDKHTRMSPTALLPQDNRSIF